LRDTKIEEPVNVNEQLVSAQLGRRNWEEEIAEIEF
jgi:hypothetical protein